MGSSSIRGTGVLPFFCGADVGVGRGFEDSDGEVLRARSAGFMVLGYRAAFINGGYGMW